MQLNKIIFSHGILILLWINFLTATPISLAQSGKTPIAIGFDGEIGHRTSTSDEAIIMGIRIAMEEINQGGGLLGGRKLKLIVKDNRSVPARGIANIKAFAEIPDLVAVVGGKFSPVIIEEIPILHEKQVIMLDAWGAADAVIDNGYTPNYCFRLSLRDSWAITTLMKFIERKGTKHIGVLLPVTVWGRGNDQAIEKYLQKNPKISITEKQWYHWGEKSLATHYEAIRKSGAEAVLLIANEAEGSTLVKEMARLPAAHRLPLISHWGLSGGAFTELAGDAITRVDLAIIQTFSFFTAKRPDKLKQFFHTANQLYGITEPAAIPSPVGAAHAYDLVHILALAVERAGSTDRQQIRAALEQVRDYDGLIKYYRQPFSPQNHEALLPEDHFMAYFREDGIILPLEN